MVSIFIPTRHGVNTLTRTLNSIIYKSSNKDNYEILFAVDTDDVETSEYIDNYFIDLDINYKKVLFEPLGYKKLHVYQNELYKESVGNMLWIFGDDVEITTQDWDKIVLDNINENYLYCYFNSGFDSWSFSIYPIVSRVWVETTSRFSNNSQTDLWLGYIA